MSETTAPEGWPDTFQAAPSVASPPEQVRFVVVSDDDTWSVVARTKDGRTLGTVATGLREGVAKLLAAAPIMRALLNDATTILDEIDRDGLGNGSHRRLVVRAQSHAVLADTEGLI